MMQYNLLAGVVEAGKVLDEDMKLMVSICEILYGALNLKNSLFVVCAALA